MSFLLETIRLGLNSLRLHFLRSVLTALGIIFGVTAVITMVSIGEGSKQDALDKIESLGARNIIVRSVKPPETRQSGNRRGFITSYGLTRETLAVIEGNFPDATSLVPLKAVGAEVLVGERKRQSQSFGTTPEMRQVANLRVDRGRYLSDEDLTGREPVAVLGDAIARALFPNEDPLGKTVDIDQQALTVVGVLAPVGLSGGAGAALVGRDLNFDVHIPITTAKDRFGDAIIRRASGSTTAEQVEVSEVYLEAPSRDRVLPDAQRLRRIIDVRHGRENDVEIMVPYELLETARRSAMTWNLVLGAIAGISLLVGGIGIMNIMLASVTERTREIGVRRALGATRRHIVAQFIVETGVLSAIGGVIGVGLGVAFSYAVGWGVPRLPDAPLIGSFFDRDVSLPTQITAWSILLSFGVATATGLIFGIYPAVVAARQDPIVALRHD